MVIFPFLCTCETPENVSMSLTQQDDEGSFSNQTIRGSTEVGAKDVTKNFDGLMSTDLITQSEAEHATARPAGNVWFAGRVDR